MKHYIKNKTLCTELCVHNVFSKLKQNNSNCTTLLAHLHLPNRETKKIINPIKSGNFKFKISKYVPVVSRRTLLNEKKLNELKSSPVDEY